MSRTYSSIQLYKREIMVTHLLMAVNISIGCGLYTDLISAWKSGRNPSANKDTISRIMPAISVFYSDYLRLGSAALKSMIPRVTMIPMTIFFMPSLSLSSRTREQQTPTMTTEMRLQDLNIITTGKLVR